MKKLVLLLTITLTAALAAHAQVKPFSGAHAQAYSGLEATWPAGSTVYPGKYVIGPSPGPGQCGEILATGDEATLHPRIGPATPHQPEGLLARLISLFKR